MQFFLYNTYYLCR